jgi:hypothetical protein
LRFQGFSQKKRPSHTEWNEQQHMFDGRQGLDHFQPAVPVKPEPKQDLRKLKGFLLLGQEITSVNLLL